MKGFFNKILKIDLGAERVETEAIPDQVYQNYLGGKGLAAWLLLRENPPGVDPLSAENRLIFALGPLSDVMAHGSARYGVFTRSPLTGFFSESYSGGTAADWLSRTGFDAIVLRGAASKPLWLEISDQGVKFNAAADLWGKETYETEDILMERAGKEAAAVVIGPAGERLIKFAIIANNHWRCAGRTGAGAVLGSKKVKGIVFRGAEKRQVADPELLDRHWKDLLARAKTDPGVANYKKYGTIMMVKPTNQAGVFPTRYWSQGRRERWSKLSGDTLLATFKVRPHACPRCFMACGKISEARTGPYAGITIEGPEYETIFAFGGLCLIESLEEIAYLNDLCDRLGLDTITAGNLAGFAMRASELGKIPETLEFGDTERVAALIREIAERRGLGAALADGIVPAAKAWGLLHEAVHVKGLEPAGYDPRPLKGMGLAYAVSPRGACHLRATVYKPELSGIMPGDQVEGKAELMVDYEDRATLFDTLIMCRFFRDLNQWDELRTLLKASTGLDPDKTGLRKIAANVTDLNRVFNLREGLTAGDDKLPRALIDRKLPPTDQVITEEEVARMVRDYYRLRGWNDKGEPPEWEQWRVK